MWIKKTAVKISAACREELDTDFIRKVEQEFFFYYTPLTRIRTLLRLMHRKCQLPKPYEEERTHIMVWRNGEQLWLDDNGRLAKLYKFLECNGCIDLEYVLYNGIGATLDRIEGIRFFYHTKELRHIPHIHAEYQGEKISIEIISLKTKGKFKNLKKQKVAIQYVTDKRDMLLEEYNKKTNGIHIFDSWA